MDFFELISFLWGPIIGAIIGLFTNWIAVKMLFLPRKALYIGKFHIPFTPGIIPARQEALATALGNAVSESLVRKEDLKKTLCSDAISHTIAKSVLSLPSIRTMGEKVLSDNYPATREKALDFVSDRILDGILAMDIGAVIAREASATVSTFAAANPLVKMFVSDAMVASLAAPIAGKVTDFLTTEGREKLQESLSEQLSTVEDKPVAELISNTEKFEEILVGLYRNLVEKNADAIVAHFRIQHIVEKKIKNMDPRDLEALVLSVMKKELNSLVWLGGFIGLVLGLINM